MPVVESAPAASVGGASLNVGGGLRRRYRYDWALFHDWCDAAQRDPLPADPLTVALFLEENPAAQGTQVRRVTAINSMHRTHQHPVPGESEPVRTLLNTVRRQRLSHLQTLLLPVIEQLPPNGWPAGLFGRRDAALLMFVALAYGYEEISRMCRADVTLDSDTGILSINGASHTATTVFPCPVGGCSTDGRKSFPTPTDSSVPGYSPLD